MLVLWSILVWPLIRHDLSDLLRTLDAIYKAVYEIPDSHTTKERFKAGAAGVDGHKSEMIERAEALFSDSHFYAFNPQFNANSGVLGRKMAENGRFCDLNCCTIRNFVLAPVGFAIRLARITKMRRAALPKCGSPMSKHFARLSESTARQRIAGRHYACRPQGYFQWRRCRASDGLEPTVARRR